MSNPFTVDVKCVPDILQLELLDLQGHIVFKDYFNPQNVVQFFKSLGTRFQTEQNLPYSGDFFHRLVCEHTFSIMKQSKSDICSWMTDEHLATVLRIVTSERRPDF